MTALAQSVTPPPLQPAAAFDLETVEQGAVRQ